MKKLKIIEITNEYIYRRDKIDEKCISLFSDYFSARDLCKFRNRICDETPCNHHYDIVQVKIIDDDDNTPLYGVYDTIKCYLI